MISPSTSLRRRAHRPTPASDRWASATLPTPFDFDVDVHPRLCVADGSVDTLAASVSRSQRDQRSAPATDWMALAVDAGVDVDEADAAFGRIVGHIAMSDVDARVAMRVAPDRLAEPDFPDRLFDGLAIAGVAPQRLELEIGERAVIAHGEHYRPTVERLRRADVRVTIGDYGIGFSSFEALSTLPVDRVRIGRKVVGRMFDHDRQQLIVRSMIQLAHEFGLEVIADGADSDTTLDLLVELGCTVVYGTAIDVDRAMPRLHGVVIGADGDLSVDWIDAVAVVG